MTVGNEGEPDDPYGYLYRPGPGDAQGGQEAPAGFGSSPYVQVGQTRYGQPQPYQQPAADPQATQPVPGMAQQPAPSGPPPGQVPSPRRDGGHGGGSRGSSRGGRGPVIGAVVAIVVVVAVIVAIVAMNGDDDKKKDAASTPPPQTSASAQSSGPPTTSAAPSSSAPGKFGEQEAEDGQLTGSAVKANNSSGYSGNGFVGGLTTPGASITVTVDAPKKGTYTLFVVYANSDPVSQSGAANRPKKTMTVKANGEAKYGQINLYGTGGLDKWWETYRTIELDEGTNTVSLACENGDSCNVLVDKLYVGDKK